MSAKDNWQWEIKPQKAWFGKNFFKELYAYKDLLLRLVRKEFLLRYQQTLLGPIWVLIQPILTVIIYVLIFDKIIKVPIPDVPPVLFYLSGITLWTLFSDIFLGTANTFLQNINVFNKVYFPRLIAPLSITLLHYMRFLIQLGLLMAMVFYFYITVEIEVKYYTLLLILPMTILTAGFGLGCGLIFSIITAKYRDLSSILNLIVSLLMFVTPIFYSLDIVPEKILWLVNLNPLSTLFEMFRYSVLGTSHIGLSQIIYSIMATIITLCVGLLLFNRNEDKLIDII